MSTWCRQWFELAWVHIVWISHWSFGKCVSDWWQKLSSRKRIAKCKRNRLDVNKGGHGVICIQIFLLSWLKTWLASCFNIYYATSVKRTWATNQVKNDFKMWLKVTRQVTCSWLYRTEPVQNQTCSWLVGQWRSCQGCRANGWIVKPGIASRHPGKSMGVGHRRGRKVLQLTMTHISILGELNYYILIIFLGELNYYILKSLICFKFTCLF